MSNLSFAEGFTIGAARSAAAIQRGEKGKVFDWDKAARRILEVNPYVASAGLAGDWDSTGGEIWSDGKPVPRERTYTYLASMWATPELDLDSEVEPCWIEADTTNWDCKTYWPDSAMAIINTAE